MQPHNNFPTSPRPDLVRTARATLFVLALFLGCRGAALPAATPVTEPSPSMTAAPTQAEPTVSPTLSATAIVETLTPSPTITFTPGVLAASSILFEEDFEDGLCQDCTYMGSDWDVITEEAGNKILDGDSRSDFGKDLSFSFGSSEWEDYALDFDVKFRHKGELRLMVRSSLQGEYILRWTLIYGFFGMNVGIPNSPWNQLKARTYETSTGVWYHMRIEAQGENLRVFVQDKLELETTDDQIGSGNVSFQVIAPMRIQFDNLRVTFLPRLLP